MIMATENGPLNKCKQLPCFCSARVNYTFTPLLLTRFFTGMTRLNTKGICTSIDQNSTDKG